MSGRGRCWDRAGRWGVRGERDAYGSAWSRGTRCATAAEGATVRDACLVCGLAPKQQRQSLTSLACCLLQVKRVSPAESCQLVAFHPPQADHGQAAHITNTPNAHRPRSDRAAAVVQDLVCACGGCGLCVCRVHASGCAEMI